MLCTIFYQLQMLKILNLKNIYIFYIFFSIFLICFADGSQLFVSIM